MIIVSGLEAARHALGAGAEVLRTPPYAACHAGVHYWWRIQCCLQQEFAHHPFTLILCCGDDAAIARDALRMGFQHIACTPTPALQEVLLAMAAQCGATLHPHA